jgi:hypothetical protein
VNTLFASKVMYVNQLIIMFLVSCHRLAKGGCEWLGSASISIVENKKQMKNNKKVKISIG